MQKFPKLLIEPDAADRVGGLSHLQMLREEYGLKPFHVAKETPLFSIEEIDAATRRETESRLPDPPSPQ